LYIFNLIITVLLFFASYIYTLTYNLIARLKELFSCSGSFPVFYGDNKSDNRHLPVALYITFVTFQFSITCIYASYA